MVGSSTFSRSGSSSGSNTTTTTTTTSRRHDASATGATRAGQEGLGDRVQDHLQHEPAAVDGEGTHGVGGRVPAAGGLGEVPVRYHRVSEIRALP